MATTRAATGPLWPFGAFFATYFAYVGVLSPYLPLYLAELRFSVVEIGLLVSLLQVLRIVGPNLWGWLADHASDRIRVLRFVAGASLLAFVPFFFAQHVVSMFVVLVLLNLFASGLAPLGETLTLHRIGVDFARYGRLRLWGSLGFIASVAAGGALLDIWGVIRLPWLAGTLLLAAVVSAWRLYDAPHAHDAHAPVSVRVVLKQLPVQVFLATCFLMVLAHGALYAYLSLYLERLGYSKTAIGSLWALGVIAEVVFFYFQARVMQRYSATTLLVASFIAAAARFAIIGTLAQSLVWLVVAQVLHAMTFGVHHAASLTLLRRWFPGRLAARGQALYTSVSYGLGGTLGGIGAAWIWEHIAAQAAFQASAMIAVIGAFVVLWLRRIDAHACGHHQESTS